jgi:hypothetical protein
VLAGNLRHRLGHATGLRLASGPDHDQLHDESLPCR